MDKAMHSNDKYFAAMETKEIGAYLQTKVNDYEKYVSTQGILDLWRKSYKQYYSGFYNKGSIGRNVKNPGRMKININHYKNFLEHIQIMTIGQRPCWDAKAINTDYASIVQAQLANNLLEYYMRMVGIEEHVNDAVLLALLFGEGWIHIPWDFSLGEDFEGKKTGELTCNEYSPNDVIRDLTLKSIDKQNWLILRQIVNKYDLANKYPDFAEDIINACIEDDNYNTRIFNDYNNIDSDNIYIYTFYHKKTAAIPDGRMVEFIDGDTIIFDGKLPYKDIPLYSIVPDNRKETPFGYTVAFDLLPIQTGADALQSSILTNQLTFGVQNVMSKKGNDVDVDTLVDGVNLIEYAIEPPQPLNLLQTPKEIFDNANLLERAMETISGVNQVARGNPEASLKSGAALALVQSMAIQFSQKLQNSYTRLNEKIGTGIVEILKEYATVPRIALIVGKNNSSYLKEFKADDLSNISRVVVDMGSAITRTLAGRVDFAQFLTQNGLLKSPEQFITLVNSGKIDPLYEGELAQQNLIRNENEKLKEGGLPQVLVIDNHVLHINEHSCVISTDEMRQVPNVVQSTLQHIQMHIEALRTADPALMSIIKQPSLMPPPMPGQMPQQGQPPLEAGTNASPKPPSPSGGSPQKGTQTQGIPKPANQPRNALTGKEFNPTTGGL